MISRRRIHAGKTKKFVNRSVGPYQIVKRVSKTCYTVEDLPYNRRRQIYRRFNAHSSQLHPFKGRKEIDWIPDQYESEDEIEDEDQDNAEEVWSDIIEVSNETSNCTDSQNIFINPPNNEPNLESNTTFISSSVLGDVDRDPEEQTPTKTYYSRAGRTIRSSRKEDYNYF